MLRSWRTPPERRQRARLAGPLLVVVLACVLAVLTGASALAGGVSRTSARGGASTGHRRAVSGQKLAHLQQAAATRAAAHRRWIASPAARYERAASRTAFRGLLTGAAARLVRRSFGPILREIGASPAAEVAASGRVLRYTSPYSAIVLTRHRRKVVERSSVPLRVRGGPVNLSLRSTASGFAPVRAPTGLSIARSLGSGVSVTPGVRFFLAGAPSRGAMVTPNTVLYPSVAADTDALTTPTAAGVDLAAVLRSPASPEVLRYRVQLPQGLHVRAVGRGAVVYRGKLAVLTIGAPAALDAQRSIVPAAMQVHGSELLISVPHRKRDLAYPVLVDPQITVDDSSPGWKFSNWWAMVTARDPGSRDHHISKRASAAQRAHIATSGWCAFLDPQPGEVVAPPGQTDQNCPGAYNWLNGEWTWSSNAVGLGQMTHVQLNDITYTVGEGNTNPVAPYIYTNPADGSTCDEQDGSPGPDGLPQSIDLHGTDCGNTITIGLTTKPWYLAGPATLNVGSIVVEAPYRPPPPLPSAAEQRGGGNPATPHWVHCNAGHPVDCATGNFYESQTDLTILGRGLPFAIRRTYNAQAAVAQPTSDAFGFGWSSTFTDHLSIDNDAGTIVVVQANGSETPFTVSGSTISPRESWIEATLTLSPDGLTYTYVLPDQTTETFDAAGRLTSESDRFGNALTMAYDPAGHLDTISDAAGRTISLSYAQDGSGHVTRASGPMGAVTYGYNTAGDLTRVTDLDGGVWQYEYDGHHRLTAMTDPLGHTLTNTYDSSDRVTAQTDGADRTTTWSYPSGTETEITSPEGNVTDEHFNDVGLPETVTHGAGSASTSTTTWRYDADMNPAREIDGNGQIWAYGYDSSGNRTYKRDPLGNVTTWTYDDQHDVTSTTDPLNHTTTYTYQAGEVTAESRRLTETGQDQTTTYAYNAQGDLTSRTDPLHHTWTFGYDSAGNRTSITAPNGDETTWTYDDSGYLTSRVSPAGNRPGAQPSQYTTSYHNDAYGRPTLVTDPLGHQTHTTYDSDGNIASRTDAAGNTTSYAYNGDNELTATTRPDGSVLATGYDGDGNVTSQTNDAGHVTRYGYNALDEKISTTDPLNRTTTYGYDSAGNLTRMVDPEGRTTTYRYDAAGQRTAIEYSDGTTPGSTYAYNADGQRASMTDGTGTTTYAYDSLSRLTQTANGAGKRTAYTYDLANNATSIQYANGHTVTRTFDSDNRLSSVADWLGGTTTFTYDADSNLRATTFPSATHDADTYGYDRADELTSIEMDRDSSTLANLAYTRDATGRVATATETGLAQPDDRSSEYHYDQANDITIGPAGGFAYDAADQLTQSPGTSYSYDALGQRTTVTTGGSATTYAYDQAGRLTSYHPAGGASTAFAYGGDGLRAAKTTGSTTAQFTWDQTRPVPVLLSDGSDSYIYGPNDVPIEQIDDGTNTPTFLHHDQIGSTRLLTDSDGNLAATYTYGAYGATVAKTGTASSPLEYAGQYTDAETGLQYDQARYYDPNTGQFLTRDPLAEETREPYTYADQDPITNSDPTGLYFGPDACRPAAHVVGPDTCNTTPPTTSTHCPPWAIPSGGKCLKPPGYNPPTWPVIPWPIPSDPRRVPIPDPEPRWPRWPPPPPIPISFQPSCSSNPRSA
jgi:RHS repeat-associated protein